MTKKKGLVKFRSEAYSDIVMFADVAEQMLHMMGLSGMVPGALLAEDVPAALEKLKAEVARRGGEASGSEADLEGGGESMTTLGVRAFPLIELLEAAEKREVRVMWQ